MSDAFTDAARDAQRGRAVRKSYEHFLDYLKDPSEEKLAIALKKAESADKIRGGWSSRTSLHHYFAENHPALVEGHKEIWLKLLSKLTAEDLFRDFKDVSPFKDVGLIFARRYHREQVTFEFPSDLHFHIDDTLEENDQYSAKYVALIIPDVESVEVIAVQDSE